MSNHPFTPHATVSLAATDTSGNVALGKPASAGQGCQVLISTLPADDPVYIAFGGAAVTAAETDMRINPGETRIFTIPVGVTHLAGICASTETAAIRATAGYGD